MWGLWWTKRNWGRFAPSISVSPANHSTDFSSIIITRGWHNRPLCGRSVAWTLIPVPTIQFKNLKNEYQRYVFFWILGQLYYQTSSPDHFVFKHFSFFISFLSFGREILKYVSCHYQLLLKHLFFKVTWKTWNISLQCILKLYVQRSSLGANLYKYQLWPFNKDMTACCDSEVPFKFCNLLTILFAWNWFRIKSTGEDLI
jgi:hypothetical protein